MSPYILSIILGIVEGLTEFLPVSSTAHLRITEALMKIPLDEKACSLAGPSCLQNVAYWKMYTIVIQVGAILALCLLFTQRIVNHLRTFPKGERGRLPNRRTVQIGKLRGPGFPGHCRSMP